MQKDTESKAKVLSLVKLMRDNATRVNAASKGRVAFLADVVDKSRSITGNVEEIQTRSHENNSVLDSAVADVGGVVENIGNVVALVDQGRSKATRMTETLDRFEHQFREVAEISSSIAQISKQTNMLALNAMIEAKRAGDFGNGFAVVAQEVKELARSTGGSANHIDKLMQSLFSEMNEIISECSALCEDMANGSSAGQNSLQKIETVGESMKAAVVHSSKTADSAAEQVAVFAGLVDQLSELKTETEAAITGSAKNVEIATNVIDALESE